MIFTVTRAVDSPDLSSREGRLIFIQEICLEHPWVGAAILHWMQGAQPEAERGGPMTVIMQCTKCVGEI